jgi:short-chain Z-isoprenyl diphosphate synthase
VSADDVGCYRGIATLNRVTVRDLVYRVYERRLLRSLAASRTRGTSACCATATGGGPAEMGYVDPNDGHRVGAERIKDSVRWCDQAGVEHVTLWLLSTDNLSRRRPSSTRCCGSSRPW